MAGIERIEESTANGVRASSVVPTMSQAVQELLSNSIDAGATSVEIKVDLPSYRLSIADNGEGIPAEKLQSLVATARATSKARSAGDMQHASTYGFRGEALYSLGSTSLIEIQSRCAGKESYAKVVREGQTLHFGPARAPSRMGTIITLRDAFFKCPVRRKAANKVTEMLRIKEQAARTALVNNSVAITILDSAKSKMVLRATPTGSVTRTFAQLFSSDKLSMARKLTFDFKQFRITGYLSPPSSTACHWSKEFQFVYVNRRCVRRLDFLQKVVNAAFAPCLTLLGGRGGADGQGVVRRIRDPNASSGQRQALFPVFVLNLECPSDEVDIMTEPDKSWVEFSDWPAARNACVAMLLAFLPHFPHAVPSSVLRDLRRAFHRNEGDDTWTAASPPPATRGSLRASPEHALSPSPSPMRLRTPDVKMSPEAGISSPLISCAWMGRERTSSRIGDEVGEAMEFEGDGVRAEGFLYPSPASRFGARDNHPSRWNAIPFGPIDGDMPITASPHFARCQENGTRFDLVGWEEGRYPPETNPAGSPYFNVGTDQRQCHPSRRESPQPLRLALGPGSGDGPIGGDHVDSSVSFLSAPSYEHCRTAAANESGTGRGTATGETHGTCDYSSGEGGGWAAEAPDAKATLSPAMCLEFGSSYGRQNNERKARANHQRAGGRARRQGTSCSEPSIPARNKSSDDWLRHLPDFAEAMRPAEPARGETDVVEGGNARSLSRLFDYAFTDKSRQQGREEPTGEGNSCRSGRGKFSDGGENTRTLFAARPKGTSRMSQGSGPAQLSSPRLPADTFIAETEKQALVGVTVRRPPSPEFRFMDDDDDDAAKVPQHPPSEERDQSQTQQQEVEGTTRVNEGDSRVSGVKQPGSPRQSTDLTEGSSEHVATPTTPVPSSGTTACGRVERSPLSPSARASSSPRTGAARILTRATKRPRPETWGKVDVIKARTLNSSPPTTCLPGNTYRSFREETRQERSPPSGDAPFLLGEDGIGSHAGWVGWTRDGGQSRHGWWGADGVDPLAHDDTVDDSHVLGEHASCDGRGKGDVMKHADGPGGTPGAPKDARSTAQGRALGAARRPGTPRLDVAREASGLQGGSHQPVQGRERLVSGRENVSDFDTVLRVGAEGESTSSCKSPLNETTEGVITATGLQCSTPKRAEDMALAYDRDVLGGDGLVADVTGSDVLRRLLPADSCDSCQVSDAGGAAVHSPQGPGGNRARKFGGEAEQAPGARSALCAGEKPMSEVLQAGQDEIDAGSGAVAVTVTPEELRQARVIGQAGRKFILLRARTGALLCVDQHAADERIKLEELERQVYGAKRDERHVDRLVLTPPESLSLTSSDGELLEQHREVLSSWHFHVDVKRARLGDGRAPAATLLAVPVVCGVRLSVQDLVGFLHYLRESVEPGSSARWIKPPQVQHILNYKACHSAIRFGDLLSRSECLGLIRDLAACARPFCCAHGRPSVVPLCVLVGGVPSVRTGRGARRMQTKGRSVVYSQSAQRTKRGRHAE